MKSNIKQIAKESLLILGFAFIIAIIYNYLNPKGINIFEKPKVVSDTVLEKLITQIDTAKNFSDTLISQTRKTSPVQHINDLNSQSPEKQKKIEQPKPEESLTQEITPQVVTMQQLKKLLGKPNLILIDARSTEEFAKGHIDGAINIFAYEENIELYFKNLTKIPFDKTGIIIVYCEGGTCDASHKVATDLIRLGHNNVFVYSGGWEEWSKQQ